MAAPRRTVVPLDLILVAAWAVLAAAAALASAPAWVGLWAAAPLVLVLPGYALLALTHPESHGLDPLPGSPTTRGLHPTERILFSMLASVGITTAVGLVLNFLPAGITRTTVALTLGGATLGLTALAAFVRAVDVPKERRLSFPVPSLDQQRPWHEWVSLVVVVLAVASAAVVVGLDVHDLSSRGYSSLFIEPGLDRACYPLLAHNGTWTYGSTRCPGPADNLTLTVSNHEHGARDYTLVLLWSSAPGVEADPGDQIISTQSFHLDPSSDASGLQHQFTMPLAPQQPPARGLNYLKANLYVGPLRDGAPDLATQLRIQAI